MRAANAAVSASAKLTDKMEHRHARPNDDYFTKRRLRRHARVLHLWAMGVGAVISGDFFGWNFGLTAGGFGGVVLGGGAVSPRFKRSLPPLPPELPPLAPARGPDPLPPPRRGGRG